MAQGHVIISRIPGLNVEAQSSLEMEGASAAESGHPVGGYVPPSAVGGLLVCLRRRDERAGIVPNPFRR